MGDPHPHHSRGGLEHREVARKAVVVLDTAESIEQNLSAGLGVAGLHLPQRYSFRGLGGNGVGHGFPLAARTPSESARRWRACLTAADSLKRTVATQAPSPFATVLRPLRPNARRSLAPPLRISGTIRRSGFDRGQWRPSGQAARSTSALRDEQHRARSPEATERELPCLPGVVQGAGRGGNAWATQQPEAAANLRALECRKAGLSDSRNLPQALGLTHNPSVPGSNPGRPIPAPLRDSVDPSGHLPAFPALRLALVAL